MVSRKRDLLRTAVKYCGVGIGLAILFVLLDFAIDIRPSRVQDSYRFEVGEPIADEVRILRSDNLSILLIRRSQATISQLQRASAGLQDPESRHSSQPDFARNPLRSRHPELFVSYAIGTDFGCGLEIRTSVVGEVCGDALYDFAGRALKGEREFENLAVPDYNFSDDFHYLTVRP